MNESTPRPMHPFLLAIAPILFLFSHNCSELPLFDSRTIIRLIMPCAISMAGAWILLFAVDRIGGQKRLLAAMLASMLLFLFFGFGHAQGAYIGFVEKLGGDLRYVIKGIPFGHFKFFFAAWMAAGLATLWMLFRWLRRRPERLPGLTVFLNRLAVILLVMAAIQIAWTEVHGALHAPVKPASEQAPKIQGSGAPRSRPDIYYIILDAYAADSTLRASYGYDNRGFLEYLTEKGFFVAEKSRSNYTATLMSLGSALNFQHFAFLAVNPGRKSMNISLPMRMVENSRLMRFLKSNGYFFVNFRTPVGPAARNRNADWDMDCNRSLIADDFLRLLIDTTLLEPFFRVSNMEFQRERILCQLATIPRLHNHPKVRRPLFVFAHILCPHYPYVFNREGQPPNATTDRQIPVKQLYVDQLIYLNKLVIRMLDELLTGPGPKPVIVLQGDHGPIDHPVQSREEAFRNRTRILNAFLLPEGEEAGLYDSITPVNSFRVILNHYFGTRHPLLEDRTFYTNPYSKSLYDIEEVTAIARYDEVSSAPTFRNTQTSR